jgi:hypothetical protein
VRSLALELQAFQCDLARTLAKSSASYRVLDTTPIPAIVRVRACRKGLFAGQASFGRNVSKMDLRLQGGTGGRSGRDKLKNLFALERHRAKTLSGLLTRLAAKIAAYTCGQCLNDRLGRPLRHLADLLI